MPTALKVIIVDDETGAQNVLRQLLLRHCPNLEVVATAFDLPQAKVAIEQHRPDVVFLDIEMPYFAGYEIVSFFENIDFAIVFVTAYNQYAIKAFELSAVDYLLKPVQVSRLLEAERKLLERANQLELKEKYGVLVNNLQDPQNEKIMVRKSDQQLVVKLSEVVAIHAQESYCKIITTQEEYMTSKNLKHYEVLLRGNSQFFRSHKSWIINKAHLERFSKKNKLILLKNQLEVRLSKYKVAAFEQFLLG